MAIVIHDFSCLKLSNSLSIFYKYLEYIISKSTAVSFFYRKQSSFRGRDLPFAKGSERKFLSLFSYTAFCFVMLRLRNLLIQWWPTVHVRAFKTKIVHTTFFSLGLSAKMICFLENYTRTLVRDHVSKIL